MSKDKTIHKTPGIHIDQTKPHPGTKSSDRLLSVGYAHMGKLESLARAYPLYITREAMCRLLIDNAIEEL